MRTPAPFERPSKNSWHCRLRTTEAGSVQASAFTHSRVALPPRASEKRSPPTTTGGGHHAKRECPSKNSKKHSAIWKFGWCVPATSYHSGQAKEGFHIPSHSKNIRSVGLAARPTLCVESLASARSLADASIFRNGRNRRRSARAGEFLCVWI